MSGQLPARARSVLRQLIRSIDRNVTSATGNTLWRQAAIEEFRQGTDPSSLEERLRLAQDYAFLLDSVREHKVRQSKP